MQEKWMSIEDYATFSHLSVPEVEALLSTGSLTFKFQDHSLFIHPSKEPLDIELLRTSLCSLQELYEEQNTHIAQLRNDLKLAQKEIEFLRRKHTLMWDQTLEKYPV